VDLVGAPAAGASSFAGVFKSDRILADLAGMHGVDRLRRLVTVASITSLPARLSALRADPMRARLLRSAATCLAILAAYGWWQLERWGGAEHKTLVGDLFFVPLNAYAVAAAWAAARRNQQRPSIASCWRLVSLALLSYLLGDVVQTYNEVIAHDRPFPSLGDGFYVAFYPLMLAAMLRLPSPARGVRQRVTLALDCAMVALSGAVLIWYMSLAPVIAAGGQSTLAMSVSVAYPLGDMVLLVGLASLVLRSVPAGLRLPLGLVAAGLLGFVITDLIYGWITVHGSYAGGDLIDSGWMLSLAFFALAGAAQQVGPRDDPQPHHPGGDRRRLSWLPYAGLGTTLTLAIWLERHDDITTLLVLVAAAVLASMVSARQLTVQSELLVTQRQLREVQAERAMLLDSVLYHGEAERVRIAAELHDGPVQRLAALGYLLERAVRVGRRGSSEQAALLVEEALVGLRVEVDGLRQLMSDLRPPALDESGLENALRDYLPTLFAETSLVVELVSELGDEQVPAASGTVLYRVAQEALLNIRQHAYARRVRVKLARHDGATSLSIEDDGVGFCAEEARARVREGHFGLVGMRERVELAGGSWHLDSTSASGTRITAVVPDPLVSPAPKRLSNQSRQRVPA
jgi:signal transduction histidine kinase